MHEPDQPQETTLKKALGGLLLLAVVLLAVVLLVTVGGPVFGALWWGIWLVGIVGFGALWWILFIGGNNAAQNAAAFRRLPSADTLAEICSEYPPRDTPPWA